MAIKFVPKDKLGFDQEIPLVVRDGVEGAWVEDHEDGTTYGFAAVPEADPDVFGVPVRWVPADTGQASYASTGQGCDDVQYVEAAAFSLSMSEAPLECAVQEANLLQLKKTKGSYTQTLYLRKIDIPVLYSAVSKFLRGGKSDGE